MPNEGKRRFQRAWESRLDKKADKPKLIPAMCGAYFNGQKTLHVSGRPDFIWARIRGKTSEVVQVFNDVLTTYWDLPILVYRDPNYPDIWKVYGRDISRYEDWGGVSYMPSHGGQHSFASTVESGNVGGDIVWVFKRQFVPMLVHPEATASMSVYAEADFYYFNGAYSWFGGTGTGDLSAYKPTGAHNARYLTVYLEPTSNRLLVLEGPEFDAIWAPSDPGEYFAVPSPDQGIPLAGVLLMTGTNQIGWGEIFDIRNIVSALGTTGVFTSDDIVWPYDNIGVYNWDEGVPQCTGTIIDWGSNLDVSCSGVVLRVDSATASGTIELIDNDVFLGPIDSLNFVGPGIDTTRVALDGTIYVHGQVWWDEGIPLCTGTIIDWGDYLNVSCSGSVIRVDVAEGGAGGDIMVWNSGSPQCTGTIIDFGDNLEATCSGTVILVTGQSGGGSASGSFATAHMESWIGTGTVTYYADTTWENIRDCSGTFTVDRNCDVKVDFTMYWSPNNNNWTYHAWRLLYDGVDHGTYWNRRDAALGTNYYMTNNSHWVVAVTAGTHGFVVQTYDGGSGLDRSIHRTQLTLLAPLGMTTWV